MSIQIPKESQPGSVTANNVKLYLDTSGYLCYEDESGNVVRLATEGLSKQSKTIASGVISSVKPGTVEITSESGAADALTKISGLSENEKVTLQAASGHTITITKGTYLRMDTTFTLTGYRTITFKCSGTTDELWEVSRAENA